MIITQSIGDDIRSMEMSLMPNSKFQCANTTCLPFVNVITSNLINCQVACLTQNQCKAATFYRSTSNCELFADVLNQNGNMLADVDATSMNVITETRFPPEPTTTISTTSSSSTTTTITTSITTSTTTSSTTSTTTSTTTSVCALSSQSTWSQTATTIFGSQAGISGSNLTLLSQPIGIYYDGANNMLTVADDGNQRILRFSLDNSPSVATVIAGSNGQGCNMDQFGAPDGIGVDSFGRLYVADYNCNQVVRFPSNSNSTTSGTLLGSVMVAALISINQLTNDIYV
ncbi:unnamed protein product, partial [Adineta steineri]